MKQERRERGQALIMVAVSAVVLFGFAALAIDGSRKFSDRRHAQNAADAAAMAAALASSRGSSDADSQTKAVLVTTENGYNGGANNDVTVTITASPAGVCPPDTVGKDIKVDIVSTIGTTFARVIHFNEMTNNVSATARECGSFIGPPFNGNAIVALAPHGRAYDANGNAKWIITGGGVFSNSADPDGVYCRSNAVDITVPSVDVVGSHIWGNCNVTMPPGVTVNDDATQYTVAQIMSYMPRQPECTDGDAYQSGGQWHPRSVPVGNRVEGSKVAFSGDMDFAPGLYCITNGPIGPYHGVITGFGVTFYIMRSDFTVNFNGNGVSFTPRAPTSGEYTGVLMFSAPQFDANGNLTATQDITLHGNGYDNITGSIIVPSANIAMYGNSVSGNYDSQIIGYTVTSRGGSTVEVRYKINHNYQAALPISLTLLK